MLIGNDKTLLKNEEVTKDFNQYLGRITDYFKLYEFPDEEICKGRDNIDNRL